MRVLVCGGRDFRNWLRVKKELDQIHSTLGPITAIIQGEAKGADECGRAYARLLGAEVCNEPNTRFPADWDTHGKKAGPIRNQQMIDEGKPDICVAFPTENSIGTYDMIRRCKKHNIPVHVFKGE